MMDTMTPATVEPVAKGLPFAKGHGTGNDFVVIPDPDGELVLGRATVAALCDRRRGLGGDGLLRVVRTAAEPEVAVRADEAEWFMDYRNADGSLAEMCGNGVRVYARYLIDAGLAAPGAVRILTRSGVVVAEVGEASVAVDMPLPEVYGQSTAQVAGLTIEGTVATCGNPNLVCFVDDPSALDLASPPTLDPTTFPSGANVEFVRALAPLSVSLRVVERGVGETLSCGSGACAAAAVVLRKAGQAQGTVTVEVPGGVLSVSVDAERCVLTGPAVIVATGHLTT
jgi:diaminopimelate epimerase